MKRKNNICEEFRMLVEKHFAFLESYGFQRSHRYEYATPDACSIVFLGKNVGISIGLDIRNNIVDAEAVKVSEGVIKRSWSGGYSSGLYTHLINHAGYRGGTPGTYKHPETQTEKSDIEQMIESWANFLISAGQSILDDAPNSLPR